MKYSFRQYQSARDAIILERTQDEAEEFLGQAFDAKPPQQAILGVLRKYNVPFEGWDNKPQTDDSVERITKAIDAAKTSEITTQQILKLENFTNKTGDKAALAVITTYLQNPQGDPRETYVKAMTARDAAEARARPYGDVGKNYDDILNGTYEPPVLFDSGASLVVVGGRTRLYAALLVGKPVKVKIIGERDIAAAFPQQPAHTAESSQVVDANGDGVVDQEDLSSSGDTRKELSDLKADLLDVPSPSSDPKGFSARMRGIANGVFDMLKRKRKNRREEFIFKDLFDKIYDISKANADKPESQDAAREGVRSILKDVEHHLGRFRKGYFTGNYSYR